MYRSSNGEPAFENMPLVQHGVLTIEQMVAMLQPGALDARTIVGHRVRWAYSATLRTMIEAKRISMELKQRHMELGAREVIVYAAGRLRDDAE